MKIGIVGLPNVGKTTFFNALSGATAPAENYPFCTIDQNIGSVIVPDKCVDKLAEMENPKKITFATVDFVDIAGLVKGAHKGEGLGNKFLSQIREVDAIAHVVRCFKTADITHVHGAPNPIDDVQIIDMELALSDLQTVEKRLQKVSRMAKGGDKEAKQTEAFLMKIKPTLEEGIPLRKFFKNNPVAKEDLPLLKEACFITAKPVMFIANVGENVDEDIKNDIVALKKYAEDDSCEIITVSAAVEAELAALEPDERELFIEELGWEIHGLDVMIKSAYRLLNYISFYTTGPDEVRAWTIVNGSTAPQAAGKIHSDIEQGFIRADIVSFDDLVETGTFSAARDKGLLRSEGKSYIMREGDVVFFHFVAPKSGK